MKLYNRDLQEIVNPEREKRIKELAENIIDFVSDRYEINKKDLQEKLERLAVVERRPRESSFIEYNGEKKEIAKESTAAAFVIHKKQERTENRWNFENAIYTSDTNSNHAITHELLHCFSYNSEMIFEENNIAYDKVGTKIKGYDRNNEEADNSLNGNGLNEGVTELLANKIDGETPTVYAYQVCIADILVNSKDNSLMKAYFSNNKKDFKEFLIEFDKRQSSVSSKELISVLPSSNFSDFNKELFKGCIEYSLSFCNTIEDYNKEKERLTPIIKNISIYNYKDIEGTDKFLSDILVKKETQLQLKQETKKAIPDSNMKFVKGFIRAYNDAEEKYQYDIRVQDEQLNIERIQKIIDTNGINRILTSDLDARCIGKPSDKDFKVEYSQKHVSAMARLLKAADLLTNNNKLNPKGIDYLKKFISIPNIEYKLGQMRADLKDENSYMYELKQKAKDNRANGNIPIYPKTECERETIDSSFVREQGLRQEIGISQKQAEQIKKDQEAAERDKKRIEAENKLKQKESKKLEQKQNYKKNRNVFTQVVDSEMQKDDEEIKINAFKAAISRSKITRSEAEKQMQGISKIKRINVFSRRQEKGEILTEEEQNLVDEHRARANQAQLDYKMQQETLRHKTHDDGMRMGR